jgi:hypothetical protein
MQKLPGEFLLDERLQRHHESLVLGTSLKFAALASELAVDELAIRRNLKGATATWFASDGAALDVGLQLHLQSIEGGLVASGTTVFDVDNERHACTVLWVVRGRCPKQPISEKCPGKYMYRPCIQTKTCMDIF